MTETPDANLPPREAAVHVLQRLRDAGYEALFAGGCVRDRLLGAAPSDYDVATDARPDDVRDLFPRTNHVGAAFGVMLVRFGGHTIEVATFRTDGDYPDGRRPANVEFSTAKEDAERRDFTINGLFEDPVADEIIDYVGGQADLAAGVIRAIGDPDRRFHEDRLRLLRAVRFAARFGFAIDPDTGAAIRRYADELAGVSRERIADELRRIYREPSSTAALRLVVDHGLDRSIFGEPIVLGVQVEHEADHPGLPFGLAALALDTSDGDIARAADRARRWSDRLLLSNAERTATLGILDARDRLEAWDDLTVARRKRLSAAPGFDAALRLLDATTPDQTRAIRATVQSLAATPSGLQPEPLVTGDDLIRLGYSPGPTFRSMLDQAYDAQLEDSVRTESEAEAYIRSIFGPPPACS